MLLFAFSFFFISFPTCQKKKKKHMSILTLFLASQPCFQSLAHQFPLLQLSGYKNKRRTFASLWNTSHWDLSVTVISAAGSVLSQSLNFAEIQGLICTYWCAFDSQEEASPSCYGTLRPLHGWHYLCTAGHRIPPVALVLETSSVCLLSLQAFFAWCDCSMIQGTI